VDCDLGIPGYTFDAIVTRALDEDVGTGDITTRCTVDGGTPCKAEIVAKDTGVVAGISVAEAVFRRLDPDAAFASASHDGERVAPGKVILGIAGDAQAILVGERTALNFLQRMSGIATLTAQFVQVVTGTRACICDTRKTAPGLRVLDKYAVRMGGGKNHRFGLSDGVLIKDNHIRAAGGIVEAVRRARESAHHLLAIEVETQTAAQVEEAVEAGADVIMLDNMGLDDVREAVRFIAGRCRTEVSGNVNLTTVRAFAECGVDLISVGALTHSVSALDLSLEIIDARG
jgi:nicotinate-nucleotide pyrophosphorylase (carboxylating)